MALLLVEGFEGFGTVTGSPPQPTGGLGRFYSVSNENYIDLEVGRLSGLSIELDKNCTVATGDLTTQDTLIVGFAFKCPSISYLATFLQLLDGATLGINLRLTTSGEIAIYRGSTLLATSATGVISANTWAYIELKVKCSDTVGTYEVRIGGVNVLSDTGIDTREGSHDYHTGVKLSYSGFLGTAFFDDWYVCDNSGSNNNDFLGNSRVIVIVPNGDDTVGWDTASGGSSHYLDVDENPADDDTSYVEDATSGHKDLYDYESMSAGLGVIRGLSVKTVCRETDAENFSLIMPIKSGVTESDDSSQAIGTTNFVGKTRISELDPDTSSAWTESSINAAKFGVKVG